MDRRLLHELAADRKCVENLTELTFSSVTLQDRDEAALKQLHNLATIGFYCCENVDSLMPSLAELQVNVLCFEMTDIAPESLSTIGTANVIGEIVFEQNLTEGQVRALQAFPATIKVTSSFPLDAYD